MRQKDMGVNMYIYDALYGKIEFPSLVWKCMLTPEVQRLREVRLCNINSLCITGSANTNRFEHSVGTAFLATLNIKNNKEKYHLKKKDIDLFVVAALLHDVANGPFGHSYEYLMEKQGFIPEKGLRNVFSGVLSYGQGVNGYSSPYEKIFFGQLRALNSIFSDSQKDIISSIIAGNHFFSKLISDKIDLDNIDNVFRMAYHMGISFPQEAPIELAKAMYLENDHVVFNRKAKEYLNAWYETRKKVYKFLLLNPQEFAGKYMLTEAMDITFEDKSQNSNPLEIKWYFTDYELLENLFCQTEKWIDRKSLLKKDVSFTQFEYLQKLPFDKQKKQLKNFVESIELTIPVKNKGKSGNSNKISLSSSFEYSILSSGCIYIKDRNMRFEIYNNNLYKIIRTKNNPSQIISRLMIGNLYDCITIVRSSDISKYGDFLNYNRRLDIENELESSIKAATGLRNLCIGIHPILDYDKTERKLEILFEDSSEIVTIGASSRDLLLGVFLKNEPYGLKHARTPLKSIRKDIITTILEYFSTILSGSVETISLYEEVNDYGDKRY